jgi:hypothetical protein
VRGDYTWICDTVDRSILLDDWRSAIDSYLSKRLAFSSENYAYEIDDKNEQAKLYYLNDELASISYNKKRRRRLYLKKQITLFLLTGLILLFQFSFLLLLSKQLKLLRVEQRRDRLMGQRLLQVRKDRVVQSLGVAGRVADSLDLIALSGLPLLYYRFERDDLTITFYLIDENNRLSILRSLLTDFGTYTLLEKDDVIKVVLPV